MNKAVATSEANLKSASNGQRNSPVSRRSSPAEEAGHFLGAVASSGGEALVSARYVRLLVGDVSTATLYRMLASGDFPKPISVTAGRKAWPLSAVQAWIRQRTTAPAEGAQL
jgi:predicted DNA-binding transcriptional regulator AlpA